MIKNNQFALPTKFGNVAVKINGDKAFYVSARLNKESGYGEQDPFVITIRNKQYNHYSAHFAVNEETNLIEIHTYAHDGNTPCFPSQYPGNEYFKIKSLYFDATTAAKHALVDEITSKLNQFYIDNREVIHEIWKEIKQSNLLSKINGLKSEIFELEKQIDIKQREISELSVNVGK